MPAHIQQELSVMFWTKTTLMYCHGQHVRQISVRLSMFGMRWSADYVICLSSQQTCSSLVDVSSRCGMTSHKTFTRVSLAPWGEDAQQWLMHKGDTPDTDFVTSILASSFSAISENTNKTFCMFQVRLTIWKISWTFINSLFQRVICHGWKNIAIFTMHSFFCWRVYY